MFPKRGCSSKIVIRCCFFFFQVVVSILDTSNSSYLAPFNVLSQRIKEGSVEANNNLKFLESITGPCQNVSAWPNSPEVLPPEAIYHANTHSTLRRVNSLWP